MPVSLSLVPWVWRWPSILSQRGAFGSLLGGGLCVICAVLHPTLDPLQPAAPPASLCPGASAQACHARAGQPALSQPAVTVCHGGIISRDRKHPLVYEMGYSRRRN